MITFIFLLLFALTCPSPLPFFLAVVCHEGAHILCALLLGMGLPRLGTGRTGLRLIYPYDMSAAKQILVCLSGPAAGILLGIIFHSSFPFAVCSVTLGIINLLPVSCFDGGGVLREVCSVLFMPYTAYRICRAVSVASVILLWILSAAVQLRAGTNYSLLFLSTVLVVAILSDAE